jgi:aminoglycoside phosphotransferase (APT) family kinase protein
VPDSSSLRAGTLGTYPTYRTGTGLVVKLFPTAFGGPASFEAERAANEALGGSGLPVPALVARGELYDDGDWRWPFLVFEEAAGVPLAEVRPSLDAGHLQVLAEDVGAFLRRLHALPPPTGTWDAYLTVLERRKRQVPGDDFRRHGYLAPHLLDGIPAYLDRFPDEARFDVRAAPTFLHADLHHDHLFVDPATGHLRSVIDWGDMLEGDRWYDFGALVTGSFRGDRRLIDACYDAYGERPDPEVQLARMLLHGFDLFDAVPDEIRKGSRSLEELAVALG